MDLVWGSIRNFLDQNCSETRNTVFQIIEKIEICCILKVLLHDICWVVVFKYCMNDSLCRQRAFVGSCFWIHMMIKLRSDRYNILKDHYQTIVEYTVLSISRWCSDGTVVFRFTFHVYIINISYYIKSTVLYQNKLKTAEYQWCTGMH